MVDLAENKILPLVHFENFAFCSVFEKGGIWNPALWSFMLNHTRTGAQTKPAFNLFYVTLRHTSMVFHHIILD